MGRKPTARRSEGPGRPIARADRDTRALLIRAATELFAKQGVAATTLTTIARRAGLTPAMVHYHFKDRDQLIDAVVDERLAPLIATVWDPVTADQSPAEILSGVVERLMTQVGQAPWVPSTWMREVLNEEGLLRSRILRRVPFEKVRLAGMAIALGQRRGEVNADLDPLLAVFSTLGLVMVHMATAKVWAEAFQHPPLERITIQRHITGLLLHGISRPPDRHRKARSRSSTRRKS